MSANNVIIVLKCEDGLKVRELDYDSFFGSACEEQEDGTFVFDHEQIKEIFGSAELIDDEVEADQIAWEMEEDYDYVEYGICYVEYPFPAPDAIFILTQYFRAQRHVP